jgi:hypothetical protein
MNVTREVITDLLPVYFSGEASEDTMRLMEDYFRENPDFERVARTAARPLEALRAAAPVPNEVEREKRDLQWVREELFRRRLFFGMALLFTFAPLLSLYSHGHLDWTWISHDPWGVAFIWSGAALCWFGYFARPGRRTFVLVWAIFWTLFPLVFGFHLFLPGWHTDLTTRLFGAVLWLAAIFFWVVYFRLRRDK